MSIATDVASIRIMAAVFKKETVDDIFQETVERLVDQVPYIDWAGIYIGEGRHVELVSASNPDDDLEWEYNSQLKFPIKGVNGNQAGVLIVRSKAAIAFDVTDVSTLETIAHTIGETITLN